MINSYCITCYIIYNAAKAFQVELLVLQFHLISFFVSKDKIHFVSYIIATFIINIISADIEYNNKMMNSLRIMLLIF